MSCFKIYLVSGADSGRSPVLSLSFLHDLDVKVGKRERERESACVSKRERERKI